MYSACNGGKTVSIQCFLPKFLNLATCHLSPAKNQLKIGQKNRDHLLSSSSYPKLCKKAKKSKWTGQSHEITYPCPLLRCLFDCRINSTLSWGNWRRNFVQHGYTWIFLQWLTRMWREIWTKRCSPLTTFLSDPKNGTNSNCPCIRASIMASTYNLWTMMLFKNVSWWVRIIVIFSWMINGSRIIWNSSKDTSRLKKAELLRSKLQRYQVLI